MVKDKLISLQNYLIGIKINDSNNPYYGQTHKLKRKHNIIRFNAKKRRINKTGNTTHK